MPTRKAGIPVAAATVDEGHEIERLGTMLTSEATLNNYEFQLTTIATEDRSTVTRSGSSAGFQSHPNRSLSVRRTSARMAPNAEVEFAPSQFVARCAGEKLGLVVAKSASAELPPGGGR
jgi:hypothetical protein